MPSPHEIVSEINSFLDTGQAKDVRAVTDMATAYSLLVQEANDRLKRCADYLRRGLRTEAIYHAEVEPDLLDLVSAVDLPRAKQWHETCVENGWDAAPALLLDIARELNEAYTAAGSVGGLLAQLRKLSLARGVLSERLAVMRALAGLDPANAQLEKDIREFEAERIRQIRAEAKEAFAAKDLEALGRLVREMVEGQWRNPAPKEAIVQVTRRARHVQVERGLRDLKALFPQIYTAYNALSYEECKALLQQWDNIVSLNQMTVPGSLQAQVQPIVDWLAGQDQERQIEREFAAACAALQTHLAEGTSVADLQALHTQAWAFDRPLPEELEQAYQGKLRELELAARRRNRIYLLAGVAATLVVGAVVAFFVDRGILRHHADEKLGSLRAQIDDDDKLQRILAAIPAVRHDEPRIYGIAAGEFDALEAEAAALWRTEQERRAKFEAAMEEAEKLGFAPAGQGKWEEAKAVIEGREQLKRRGDWWGAARKRAGDWERGWLAEQDRIYREKLKTYYDDIVKLTAEVGEIRPLIDSDPVEYLRRVASLALRAKVLAGNGDIRAEHRSGARSLGNRINADTAAARATKALRDLEARDAAIAKQKREAEKQAIEALGLAAAGGATQLKKALDTFVETCTYSSKVAFFKMAAAGAPDWQAVEKWDALVTTWKGDLPPAGEADIDKRTAAVKAYLGKCPATPLADALQQYLEYLAKAKASVGEGNPWKTDLPEIIGSDLMKLFCFKTTDGKVWYVAKEENAKRSELGIDAQIVLTKNVERTKFKHFNKEDIEDFAQQPKVSPQSDLGDDMLLELTTLRLTNWETFGLGLAETVQKASAIDAIFRAMLLEAILTYVRDTGWGAEEKVAAEIGRLAGFPLDSLLWMNPTDGTANKARPTIATALKRMPSFAGLKRKVLAKRDGLFGALRLDVRGRGVAVRGDKGAWRIVAAAGSLPPGRSLWVVVPDVTDETARLLRRIGKVAKDGVQLDPTKMGLVIEGTMVFIRNAP